MLDEANLLKSSHRVLILGASGLIGNTLFRVLSTFSEYQVYGSLRSRGWSKYFPAALAKNLFFNIDAAEDNRITQLFETLQPDVVINCIGITKHIAGAESPLVSIPINSVFPHFLLNLCKKKGSRLIHISSDCVFSGKRGGYREDDLTDALDLYGRTKALGEILHDEKAVTIRTSTIGHELGTNHGLLNWFFSQKIECEGFREAYFSGLPTVELAKLIGKHVIPFPKLWGLYHVGAQKISKFELLNKIARVYGKSIIIKPNTDFKLDRSLDSNRFYLDSGYTPPSWDELIELMYSER